MSIKIPALLLSAALMGTAGAWAQSGVDAGALMVNQLNGTARFQAMAGAFTALGGDLSTLGQNPAGIAIYRSQEVGIGADVDMQSAKATSQGSSFKMDQTKGDFSFFGYVGATRTGNSTMPYFTWGASYNRLTSFARRYSGYVPQLGTSLSNYTAAITDGYKPQDLLLTDSYNPYMDSQCYWLSILAYNSYLVNPVSPGSDQYNGLWQQGTHGDASFEVEERGYVDEYNIDFGGNVLNTLYWGVGVGITDLDYTRYAYYDESLAGARVADADATGTETGSAEYSLVNNKHVSGTGFNFKVGLIFKPINEFRLGLAVHTPTWYSLTENYNGQTYFDYSSGYQDGHQWTDEAGFDWRLRSPWRMMIGAAGVIGKQAILSVDYERVAYADMKVKSPGGYYSDSFVDNPDANRSIKDCYQASNILRLGAELRVLPWLSLRAGYSWQSSMTRNQANDGSDGIEVYTAGTDPSYTFDRVNQYVTAGLGLRYQGFYFDMAYVYRNQKSTYHGFTDYYAAKDNFVMAPTAEVVNNNSKLVFSMGLKF